MCMRSEVTHDLAVYRECIVCYNGVRLRTKTHKTFSDLTLTEQQSSTGHK